MLLYTKHLCASGVWVAYGSIQVVIEKESCRPGLHLGHGHASYSHQVKILHDVEPGRAGVRWSGRFHH